MDKFHVEPVDWADLFDYLDYTDIDSQIHEYLRAIAKQEQ